METVVIRIYASYDADLVWLCECGVSMATFAQNALTSYVYDKELQYVMPEVSKKKAEINRTFRTRFTVRDEKVIEVLKRIKPRKKNLFIKTLMRNALVRQNMAAFFSGSAEIEKENEKNKELLESGYSALPIGSRKTIACKPAVKPVKKVVKPAVEVVPDYQVTKVDNTDDMIPVFEQTENSIVEDDGEILSMFESINENY